MRALACGLSGLALLVVAAGCQPRLAEVSIGEQEEQWADYVKRSYTGFQPPRTPPVGVKNNVSEKLIQQESAGVVVTEGPGAGLAVEESFVQETEIPAVAGPQDPAAAFSDPDAAPEPPPAGDGLPAGPSSAAVAAPDKTGAAVPNAAPGVVPDAAPNAAGEVIYVVKPGDTLSKIALKFYKDASKYDLIYRANSGAIKNPNNLRLGTKLVIPQM